MTADISAKKFAEVAACYDKVFHSNVLGAVSLFFPRGCDVLDLGCGPGLIAEKVVATGRSVTLVDQHAEYLEAAQQRVPEAKAYQVDLLTGKLPRRRNAMCLNVTGYFNADEHAHLLGRLVGTDRLLINFFLGEDQGDTHLLPFFAGVENDVWRFDYGEFVLELLATNERALHAAFTTWGWVPRAVFMYTDNKTERLYCLERA